MLVYVPVILKFISVNRINMGEDQPFAKPKTLLQELEKHGCWELPSAGPAETVESPEAAGDTSATRVAEYIRMAAKAARPGSKLTSPALFPVHTLGHDRYISLSDIAFAPPLKQALDLPDRRPQPPVSQNPQAPAGPIHGIDFAPPLAKEALPPLVQEVVDYTMDQWRRNPDRLPKKTPIKRHFEGWSEWPAGETQFSVNGHFRLRPEARGEVLISSFSAYDLGMPQNLYYYFMRPGY